MKPTVPSTPESEFVYKVLSLYERYSNISCLKSAQILPEPSRCQAYVSPRNTNSRRRISVQSFPLSALEIIIIITLDVCSLPY